MAIPAVFNYTMTGKLGTVWKATRQDYCAQPPRQELRYPEYADINYKLGECEDALKTMAGYREGEIADGRAFAVIASGILALALRIKAMESIQLRGHGL